MNGRGTGSSTIARDGRPKYQVIRDELVTTIEGLDPGSRLPAESTLAAEFQVTRGTVRQAIHALVEEGRLEARHGSGTFVADVSRPFQVAESLADRVRGFGTLTGGRPPEISTRFVRVRIARAEKAVTDLLAVSPAEPLVELVRVRSVEGRDHHVITTWLSAVRYPDVARLGSENESLYGYLEAERGIVLRRSVLTLTVETPEPLVAATLGRTETDVALVLRSTVFDADDHTVAVNTTVFADDNAAVSFRFEQPHG